MLFIQFWFSQVSEKNYLCSFQWTLPKKKERKKMTHGRGLSKNHSYQIIALEYYSGFSEE
jgi:hypothetical protein